jgi:hypothetical protein
MDTQVRDNAAVQALVDRHFAIWNEHDAARRSPHYADLYSAGIVVADYAGMAVGVTELDAKIDEVLKQHPGFAFHPEPATWNHGIGRVRWGFGPTGNPDQVRGQDIFTIEDGKIASLHVFIDLPRP